PHNVLIDSDTLHVWLIDFEAACEEGIDTPSPLHTAGFAQKRRLFRRRATSSDDVFALGSLMLSYLFPINALLEVKPDAHRAFLAALRSDLGIPDQSERLILDLMEPSPSRRAGLGEAIARLPLCRGVSSAPAPLVPRASSEDVARAAQRAVAYILGTATPRRTDRLFPGAAEGFQSGGVGLAYGAAGVVYVANQVQGRPPG